MGGGGERQKKSVSLPVEDTCADDLAGVMDMVSGHQQPRSMGRSVLRQLPIRHYPIESCQGRSVVLYGGLDGAVLLRGLRKGQRPVLTVYADLAGLIQHSQTLLVQVVVSRPRLFDCP